MLNKNIGKFELPWFTPQRLAQTTLESPLRARMSHYENCRNMSEKPSDRKVTLAVCLLFSVHNYCVCLTRFSIKTKWTEQPSRGRCYYMRTWHWPFSPKICDPICPKCRILLFNIWLQCGGDIGGSKMWEVKTLKADSNITYRAHAIPLPWRTAKALECVFPIWFTQCGRVWFTLAMPRPCHALTMPFFPRLLPWVERHGQSMACARHGKCESDTSALHKSNGKDTL